MNSLRTINELEYLYPDIQGQLCSRHSSTLSTLKQVFKDLYSYEPTHCAIANGIVNLTPPKCPGLQITFAIENGVMIYFRRTQPEQDLYVNSNRWESELIVSNKGQIKGGNQCFFSEKMCKIWRHATQDLSFLKIHGGIMYIHSNIPEGCFKEEETWLTAFYLAIAHMNEVLEDVPLKQLVKKMLQTNLLGEQSSIQNRVYNYLNRQLCVRVKDMVATVTVPRDVELLFYSLKTKFGQQNIAYNISETELINELKQNYQTTDFLQILSKSNNFDSCKFSNKHKKFLEQQNKIFKIMDSCTTSADFNKLIKQILILNQLYYRTSQSGQEQQKQKDVYTCKQVKELTQNFKTDGYLLLQDHQQDKSHIIFSISKKRKADLIHNLRQSLSPKKNKSKDILGIGRWNNKVPSNQQIFSGLPSRGLGVLDPSHCMWFND